jgi:hypothetical protein
MCLTAGAVPAKAEIPLATPPKTACLFSSPALDGFGKETPSPEAVCIGLGCPSEGQSPQYRITARAMGQRFAVSYIQAFIY